MAVRDRACLALAEKLYPRIESTRMTEGKPALLAFWRVNAVFPMQKPRIPA
jgi:hypothetical protein